MKFTAEQAIEEIKGKITAKDKDIDLGRTIKECVENALKMVGENEELELSAFVDFVQPFVATSAGLARKNAATATKTLQDRIAELEKQVNTAEPPKVEPNGNEPSAEMKALLERLEALENDKKANETKAKIDAKRDEIAAGIKKLGVDDKDWVNTLLGEVSITEETDVEQKAKDYVALYNKTHSGGSSITPKPSGNGGGEKIDLSGLDAALAQLRGNFGKSGE